MGFTGSVAGGRALFDLAVSRPDPIPFYGELGSINPVVLTAAAVAARASELASGLVASFTLGAGQFCTKPGVVFVPAGVDFESAVAEATAPTSCGRLLTDRIAEAFPAGIEKIASDPEVTVVAGDIYQNNVTEGASPVVLATTATAVVARPQTLLEECFGPATLLVSYDSEDELFEALHTVPGSLTATVHAAPGEDIADLVAVLRGRAGRVLFDGWPTGVAVNWAQHHGGPWPATTSLFTSVGATAARRFQRPVAYQNAGPSFLWRFATRTRCEFRAASTGASSCPRPAQSTGHRVRTLGPDGARHRAAATAPAHADNRFGGRHRLCSPSAEATTDRLRVSN